jgi:hypothetical protein
MAHFVTTSIAVDHPAKKDVLSLLGASDWILIPRAATATARQCYQNVKDAADKSGGKVVLGWMVHLVPDIYIELMHHAVWQRPDGALIDITAPQDGDGNRGGSIVFVPDDSIAVNFVSPVPVTSRYVRLVSDPDLDAFIKAYEKKIELFRTPVVPYSPEAQSMDREFKKANALQARLAARLNRRREKKRLSARA